MCQNTVERSPWGIFTGTSFKANIIYHVTLHRLKFSLCSISGNPIS
jgi:hypothetical protein